MPFKNDRLLLIFTRNPELGRVKTRLAADMGKEAALDIYLALLEHTASISAKINAEKIVYYSEGIQKEDLWTESVFRKNLQQGQNLGERMENAFRAGFEEGFGKVLIIGSDLYDLSEEDLEKAFLALDTSDYVLGPAQDGGYYCFGMTKMTSQVFKNKTWSTKSVLAETLKDLKNETVTLLQEKNDIDTAEDLQEFPELQRISNEKNKKL